MLTKRTIPISWASPARVNSLISQADLILAHVI